MTTVPFKVAIPYGDKELREITMRPPLAGDLRGIKLRAIHDMEWDAFAALVPRISTPHVSAGQLAALEAPDVMQVIEKVLGFFGD